MKNQVMAMLVGGIIPAVILGFFCIFQKASSNEGISPGVMMIFIGIAIAIVGMVYTVVFKEYEVNFKSGLFASITGLFWGIATCMISYALSKYGISISKLVPLYNMNTLVGVFLGLLVFAEWKDVNVLKISAASILIVLGGVLATNS
jgi:glucose uptake protein GlcU